MASGTPLASFIPRGVASLGAAQRWDESRGQPFATASPRLVQPVELPPGGETAVSAPPLIQTSARSFPSPRHGAPDPLQLAGDAVGNARAGRLRVPVHARQLAVPEGVAR